MRTWSTEPLFQFLLIGGLLFALHSVISDEPIVVKGNQLSISTGQVMQIAKRFELLTGRLPSNAELEGLLSEYVEEEVAYREALKLGLDINDTVVRRRMQQKLNFLVESDESIQTPTRQQLQEWMLEQGEQYLIPKKLAFKQRLVSVDKYGSQMNQLAKELLQRVLHQPTVDVKGGDSMLPDYINASTQAEVAILFGNVFAETLFLSAKIGWVGQIPSPFGIHIVSVGQVTPAHPAKLQDFYQQVLSDWRLAHRTLTKEQYVQRLHSGYNISIDLPEQYREVQIGN